MNTHDHLNFDTGGAGVQKKACSTLSSTTNDLKILLIQPPETGGVKTFLAHFKGGMKDIGLKQPLGLLSVASAINKLSCHDVKVIDAIAERLTFDGLLQRVLEYRPDVVGISAWTDFWWPAYRTGEVIKQALPDSHLCYGGPHVGIFPEETLSVPFVDSVVIGDGEIPFLYLCNGLSRGEQTFDCKGIHTKSLGGTFPPMTQYVQADLDALPELDRTLLPIENYG